MQITKDILLQQREKLESQISELQKDLVAKDGAIQLIDGLLKLLELPEQENQNG